MIFFLLILAAFAAWAMWWLSGFDAKVTGEDKQHDFKRRLLRCLATAFLMAIFFGPSAVGIGYAFVPLILIVPPLLGVIWASCLAELFARGFHRLIDSDDRREFDLNAHAHAAGQVAELLKRGRREDAAKLVEEMKKAGDASVQVLETMLARAGVEREDFKKPRPLVEASRLRAKGRFSEAETALLPLLAENPANVDAALMLIRLYAQDLRRCDKAAETLRWLQTQPHVPPAAVEYAILSLKEWSEEKPKPAEAAALPESVDELLAGGYLGTAVEILEHKTREQPDDFDAWLKLAEAHAVHSGNLLRAKKIVQNIEHNHAFTPEQIQQALAKLNEWQAEIRPKAEG